MLNALQKASWMWMPVSKTNRQDCIKTENSDSLMVSTTEDVSNLKQRQISSDWHEIPVSDEDENISPRGILEFRKISECGDSECLDAVTESAHTPSLGAILTSSSRKPDVAILKNNQAKKIQSVGFHKISRDDYPLQNQQVLDKKMRLLEEKLSDAITALHSTQTQADGLRDRLRFSTAAMRDQAKKMQSSANALKHTLDKVAKYKDALTKAQSERDVTELQLSEYRQKIADYEHEATVKKSELKAIEFCLNEFNQIIDSFVPHTANEQLKGVTVKEKCDRILQKITEAITRLEVKNVIDRIVDAIDLDERELKTASRIISLERSCEQFRKLTRNTEQKIEQITCDNTVLKNKLNESESSLVKIKEDCEAEMKINNLEKDRLTEREKALSEEFSKFQIATKESFSNLKGRLGEKDDDINKLTEKNHRLLEERENILEAQKSNSLMCDVGESDPSSRLSLSKRDHAYEDVNESPLLHLRSNSHSDPEIFHLQLINAELRQLLAMKTKTNLSRDIDRMTASYRELNCTCHQQQVTIQNLRTENRHLRKSVTELHMLRLQRDNVNIESSSSDTKPANSIEKYMEQEQMNSASSEDHKLPMIEENSDESTSVGTTSFSLENLTFNTAVVRPFNIATRSGISFDKEKQPDASTGVCVKTSRSAMVFNNDSSTDTENDIAKWKLHKRRPKMSHSHNKLPHRRNKCLPIWRQENPRNIFHPSRSDLCAFPLHKNEELDDVFTTSPDTEEFLPLQVCDNIPVLDDEQIPGRSSHDNDEEYRPMLGIPMSQDEFNKLTDVSAMSSACNGALGNTTGCKMNYSSSKDDGYCSSVISSSDVQSCCLAKSKVRSLRKNDEKLKHCYVTYKGVTFDARSFNLTQMRNVAWAAGISESIEEMDDFLEFLSKKSHELNEDSEWRGRHSLGKPFDWMNMRGHY